MYHAIFTDADGNKLILTDADSDDLMEKMADHARGLFPDPSVLPRDASGVVAMVNRSFPNLGTFQWNPVVLPVSLWLFVAVEGGATYTPKAVKVGSAEVDCQNMQVLGVGNGSTPLEAWQDLIAAQPDLTEQGWEAENIIAYPLAGGALHDWK